MKQSRRGLEIFSLSFLDCICCGFGALILLFVLSKFGAPVVMEEIREDLEGKILQLEQTLHELRGETAVLNRELTGKEEQLSEEKLKLARLQGELSRIEGEFAASRQNSEVQNIIEGKLARALQDLTEEMQRLQKERPRPVSSSVVGIPVDSEYIVFIIDTSGSMQSGAWGYMQEKMQEILNVYPRVKGIQVMNDDGIFMFPQYQGQWIPDSPARRKAILKVLSTWRPFSNSSPVEGIEEAISKFRDPNKKISLYVLGDEFAGEKMQQVVEKVDRMNRGGPQGSQPVRIHAVGFPTVLNDPRGITGIRFATLMRVLCQKNGGAFVGLNTTRP
ncbi:MAG: VWA domain-containing protein [Desulfobacterota bacterium]|jgi:hypothetical protein|nr:VWA domain-containing protein [Thermodesulfobacteriota bacterium]